MTPWHEVQDGYIDVQDLKPHNANRIPACAAPAIAVIFFLSFARVSTTITFPDPPKAIDSHLKFV